MRPLRTIFAAILTTSALLLAACSNSETTSGPSTEEQANAQSDPQVDQITVGVMDIAPAAPIVYGIEHGIFEDHDLEVEYDVSRGGAVMLPAVETGEYDFGIVNPLSVMNANDSGLNMRILTGFANGPTDRDDVQGVVTRRHRY